jgi:hypothetical protein
MRQHLSFREHFRRGNALPIQIATLHGSTAFGGLDRLAVDDASRWTGFAARRLAHLQLQFKIVSLSRAASRKRPDRCGMTVD